MKKNKSYHHKDLKNDLIKKGIELVNSEGLKSFSLRKVAAACGVSHGAPYSHFRNKEELLDEIQFQITKEFSNILNETIAKNRDQPNILEHLGKTYVMFFMKNPHYFSFLYTQSSITIDLTFSENDGFNYEPFQIFKNLALLLMDKANYPKNKQKDAVIALWSFIHGITSLATMKNVCYDENWETKISDFMYVFNCSFLESI